MFALIDCNNFYAGCERVFQPHLRDTPIVVLSNNDGCVIARCNLAKKMGIPMGAPAFEYRTLFEQNHVQVFSSNYALYGDMSNRVMSLLSEFTPDMEVYSIDEAFLNLEGVVAAGHYEAYAEKIRLTVTRGTGLPISVGVAASKALSKVANKIAKKYPEHTGGKYVLDSEEKRIKALRWLPVEDIWGIGYRHAKRLRLTGISNALEFSRMPEEWVRRHMSVVGLRLQKELKGIPCFEMEQPQPKQNIAVTRSFDKHNGDYAYVRERITTFAVTCGEKLRRQQSCCSSLMVFIQTNRMRTDLPQYYNSLVMPLPFPTNSGIELARFAAEALKQIFRPGYQYKKVGVIVMQITPEHIRQINLFENSDERHKPLMQAMDRINTMYGVTRVKLASQDPGRTWKMRQEKLSPCYTTRLRDVIRVKA